MASNFERAAWAEAALWPFIEKTGGDREDPDTISDLIADLLHYAELKQIDTGPLEIARKAIAMWSAESRSKDGEPEGNDYVDISIEEFGGDFKLPKWRECVAPADGYPRIVNGDDEVICHLDADDPNAKRNAAAISTLPEAADALSNLLDQVADAHMTEEEIMRHHNAIFAKAVSRARNVATKLKFLIKKA